jgi:hypothetical protein
VQARERVLSSLMYRWYQKLELKFAIAGGSSVYDEFGKFLVRLNVCYGLNS